MRRAFFHRASVVLVGLVMAAGPVSSSAEEAARPRRLRPAPDSPPSQGPDASRRPGKRAPARAEAAVRSALPPELTDHMPVGRSFLGVAIPSYEGDELKSVMTADTVTRVDEQYLDLVNLVVHVYNAEGEAETTIAMDEAAYDLVAGELASKTPSTIEQARFIMTGDKMTFQTGSQVARLVGNVRLVVPDADQLAPDFGLPGAKPAAKPAAADTP